MFANTLYKIVFETICKDYLKKMCSPNMNYQSIVLLGIVYNNCKSWSYIFTAGCNTL